MFPHQKRLSIPADISTAACAVGKNASLEEKASVAFQQTSNSLCRLTVHCVTSYYMLHALPLDRRFILRAHLNLFPKQPCLR